MARPRTNRAGNPGAVRRFLGGALRKAEWVLPFEEFVERVRGKMVRRGIHEAGEPLEPMVVEALRDQWEEAVQAYQEGGPEQVSRYLGGGRRNPRTGYMWAVYGGRILWEPEGETYGVHEDWFEGVGIPSSGRDYDRITRGFAWVRPDTVDFEEHHDKEVPQSVVDDFYRRFGKSVEAVQKRMRRNPLDAVAVVGLGVLAGAVQGIVEPYVTRHVYGRGVAPVGTAANPVPEGFYAGPDDWPLYSGRKWWSVYDSVSGEKVNLKLGVPGGWRYGSERLAQKAADKLNRDLAAGRIRVDVIHTGLKGEGGGRAA